MHHLDVSIHGRRSSSIGCKDELETSVHGHKDIQMSQGRWSKNNDLKVSTAYGYMPSMGLSTSPVIERRESSQWLAPSTSPGKYMSGKSSAVGLSYDRLDTKQSEVDDVSALSSTSELMHEDLIGGKPQTSRRRILESASKKFSTLNTVDSISSIDENSTPHPLTPAIVQPFSFFDDVNSNENIVRISSNSNCEGNKNNASFQRRSSVLMNHHILVVQRTSAEGLSSRHVFSELFQSVTEAKSEAEGLAMISHNQSIKSRSLPFDVILVDTDLSAESDGLSLIRQIRAMGYEGRIIGVTGDAQSTAIDRIMSTGADIVLKKPVDITSLREAMLQDPKGPPILMK